MNTLNTEQSALLCHFFYSNFSSGRGRASFGPLLTRQSIVKLKNDSFVHDIISSDKSIGTLFQDHRVLDDYACKILQVAEKTGDLTDDFSFLESTYKRKLATIKETFHALLPVFVMIAAFLVLNHLIGYITLNSDVTKMTSNDPIYHSILIGSIEGLIGIAIAYFCYFIVLASPVNALVFNILQGISKIFPNFKDASRLWSLSDFCHYFARGLNAGIDLNESLKMANLASGCRWINDQEDVSRKIYQGETLDTILKSKSKLPPDLIDMIKLANDVGRLPEDLLSRSRELKEESEFTFKEGLGRMTAALQYLTLVIFFAWYAYNLLGLFECLPL